ncbi:MAG: trehalose-phosphatase [Gammaproteobacteria bacterium]
MQSLPSSPSLDDFWQRLAHCGTGVLLLDYDGTLAPFHEDPAAAVPYPGVVPLIDRIVEQGRSRVAIVTGRSVVDGLPQLALHQPVDLWGGHGREHRRADGSYHAAGIDEATLKALLEVDGWADQVRAAGGRPERKPGSTAFHWRGLPDASVAAIRELLTRQWNAAPEIQFLRWLEFDGGIELAAPNGRKSDVVNAVLKDAGDIAAAFLGDDRTDEDGFAAIRGRGIGVLVRPVRRRTAADVWIRPPDQLLEFLATWARTLDQCGPARAHSQTLQ